ncbi:MAG: 50S ribosomal protein L17 [Candidatus Omnitrophota bacterium]
MRHKKSKFQLNRFTSWRRATLKSLVKNLLIHQSIRTTKTRACAVKPLVDKVITLGKDNSLSAKREAYRILGDHRLVSLLFTDIAPRFNNRDGGYSRLLNLARRRGDNAEMVILELTEIKKREYKKIKKEKADQPDKSEKSQVSVEEKVITDESKPKTETFVNEGNKPPHAKKPKKNFLSGIRNIFKKERDSL